MTNVSSIIRIFFAWYTKKQLDISVSTVNHRQIRRLLRIFLNFIEHVDYLEINRDSYQLRLSGFVVWFESTYFISSRGVFCYTWPVDVKGCGVLQLKVIGQVYIGFIYAVTICKQTSTNLSNDSGHDYYVVSCNI